MRSSHTPITMSSGAHNRGAARPSQSKADSPWLGAGSLRSSHTPLIHPWLWAQPCTLNPKT